MPHTDNDVIISQTQKWIVDVVVGCNFCPFAAKEVKRGSIYYAVLGNATVENILNATVKILNLLDNDKGIETALLILPNTYEPFTTYLDMVDKVEMLLVKEDYEGVYQIASFHPQYVFAGSHALDASNYTNRSPYPMLHFLREESVSRAVDAHSNIDDIPINNIKFTEEKGLHYMQELLAACMI
jgi:uncharacterized protein